MQTARVPTADDVEELVDRYVHRPLARPLVRVLARTSITPNQVTILAGLTGILAGASLAFSLDRPWLRLVAAALLLGSTVLDCADGGLARAQNRTSPEGSALDGVADEAVGVAVIMGAAYVARQNHDPWFWVLGAVALVSSAAQCFLFDVAKERYLARFGIPHKASKLAMADRRAAEATVPERPGRVRAWLLGTFDAYARRVRALAFRTLPAGPGDPAAARRRIRLWATMGLGTHLALGYTAIVVSFFWVPALELWLFFFSTVMNAALLLLLLSEALEGSGHG